MGILFNQFLVQEINMILKKLDTGFEIYFDNKLLISHTKEKPFLYVGSGNASYDMYRGNFEIKDHLIERISLKEFSIERVDTFYIVNFLRDNEVKVRLRISKDGKKRLKIDFAKTVEGLNRIWIRIPAEKKEKIYGCGEQFSYFNLRGKNFPLWSSEPGVGRNKKTYVTWQADVVDRAGGNYFNTYYPQPTFVSSKKYYCHLECSSYMDFDFSNENFHELQCWDIPEFILFDSAETFVDLAYKLSGYFGRQEELPDWIYDGLIIGMQGGTDTVIKKVDNARKHGVKIAGVWCQDWIGSRYTSFGKRVNWNYEWSPEVYPELDKKLPEWKKDGIHFMGYITPFVLADYPIFNEAKNKNLLAKNIEGGVYLVDFGEFDCGIVDFTNPKAFEWYKGIIKKNLIEFGLSGWMADFGEYLPTDCILHNGKSGEIMHNLWPQYWAKVNYEACKESGKFGDLVYFMRSGFTGNQKHCRLMFSADQCVDWSMDDGIATTIPAALSMGIIGNGLTHCDIGGYTTLHGLKRTKEIFMRWAEMDAFSLMMRTHEGNRPQDNHQLDTDEETLKFLAKMTTVYTTLKPYIKSVAKENSQSGLPVQRALFVHYENDEKTYDIKYQYMLGRDLIVAPVYNQGAVEWKLYLPEDNWIHIWTGKEFKGGEITISAPLGQPPVFYRNNSKYNDIFKKIRDIK